VTLDTVVLTAFRNDEWPTDELSPWLDREWPETTTLPRACSDYGSPIYHDESLGVLATGVGPTAAATTVTSLLSSPLVGDDTTFLTAGIAGGPPELPVGSVVVGASVVDWDRKHRTDDGVEMLDFRPREYVYDLDSALADTLASAAERTALGGDGPTVTTGTVVAGGEFWHGHDRAAEVQWLCGQYDAGPYRATVTEDAGTAHALARHDALDRYGVVRAIANHDRPTGDSGGVHSWEEGLETAVANVYAVASAAVKRR